MEKALENQQQAGKGAYNFPNRCERCIVDDEHPGEITSRGAPRSSAFFRSLGYKIY